MALRVFLTADLHIGMKFAEYPAAQAALVEERLACLERMIQEATRRRCELFVIAGDLFHRVSISKRDVQRAAQAVRGFGGRCVAILPGNHDFLCPDDDLWRRFRDAAGDAVLLLERERPYPLAPFDIDACLYPGPCTSIHSSQSAVGWVRSAARDASIRHHLGIAHGSLEGVSPDFTESYYPMSQSDLLACPVDAWMIGHTHLRFPAQPSAGDRIFLPGTPAPDGFDCAHEGTAWALSFADAGPPQGEPVRTGSLRFVDEEVAVRSAADLEKVESRYAGAESGRTLLRLRLRGRVARELIAGLGQMRARMAEGLLHLDLRTEELREEVTRETIDREFPEGSFPHALLVSLEEDPDALEAAYDLLQENGP